MERLSLAAAAVVLVRLTLGFEGTLNLRPDTVEQCRCGTYEVQCFLMGRGGLCRGSRFPYVKGDLRASGVPVLASLNFVEGPVS